MGTRKRERELKQLVARLTSDFEITKQLNGHFRITVMGPLGSRFVIAACTASDHRADKNLVANLARALVEVQPEDPALIQPIAKVFDVTFRSRRHRSETP